MITYPTTEFSVDVTPATEILRELAEAVRPELIVDALHNAGMTAQDDALTFIRETFGEGSAVEAAYRRTWGC